MGERAIQEIAVGDLICRPQVRESCGFREEELAGLAQSIKQAGGILQPLLARRDGTSLVLVDGERRLRAAIMAGLATVPVIVEEQELSEADATYRQVLLDAQKVGLGAMERARAIHRLMEATQWSAAQLAVRLGVSPASVSKLLALLELPEHVQQQVASGQLAMSAAYELARVKNAHERDALASEASAGRLTRDALSRKIRRIARGQADKSTGTIARVTAMLGEGRSVTVSGKGLSIETLVEWVEQLLAQAKKARAQGLELATFAQILRDKSKKTKGGSSC